MSENSCILLLNGPPGSGKDTIGNIIQSLYENHSIKITRFAFADPIKKGLHALLGIDHLDKEIFETSKDKPLKVLTSGTIDNEETLRDCYIDIAENFMRKKYGKDIFAKIAVNKINTSSASYLKPPLTIITDLGFDSELDIIQKALKNSYYISVWNVFRPEKDFSKDSRNYVYPKNELEESPNKIVSIKIINDGPLHLLSDKVRNALYEWGSYIKLSEKENRNNIQNEEK